MYSVDTSSTPIIINESNTEHVPLQTELMQGERYNDYGNTEEFDMAHENAEVNHGMFDNCICASCCLGYPLVDNSEPCFWILCSLGIVGIIYAGIETWWFFVLLSGIAVVVSFVAGWRIRKLGVAKQVMESVSEFKHQNTVLTHKVGELKTTNRDLTIQVIRFTRINDANRIQIQELASENRKFLKLNGLLEGNVENIETAKNQLFALLDKYERENEKFKANNLMSLFFLVDRDNNSFLTTDECMEMNEYVRNVYNIDMSAHLLDTNNDTRITIKEFTDGLRNELDARNTL